MLYKYLTTSLFPRHMEPEVCLDAECPLSAPLYVCATHINMQIHRFGVHFWSVFYISNVIPSCVSFSIENHVCQLFL